MSLRAVVFDAGNTLVYIDPGRVVDVFRSEGVDADLPGFFRAEARARKALLERVREGHAGTEPEVWQTYFGTLFRLAGVPEAARQAVSLGIREIQERAHLWTHVAEGTEEVLETLLERGYRLAVVSNADGRVADALNRAGLGGFLEFVLDSQVVGVEKPDPRIFLMACERLGQAPEACLYVGDLYPVDYVGARGAGLSALLLDPLGMHQGSAHRIESLRELPPWLSAHGGEGGGALSSHGPSP